MTDSELQEKKNKLEQLTAKAKAVPAFQAVAVLKDAGILAGEIVCELAAREVERVNQ
ncbi:MAG: hypothetical protein IBX50_13970 [Marinospirillum sp.]|uniref:hypothetical protein n=1 Tax=Marinospirillum sp. TaxID=2183934 RepID=UPI0019EBB9C4|nr:hypothetical protein [Marinospirillum sp.]MBE0507794.1 hypothetical protein [Marinospirillum sp.]